MSAPTDRVADPTRTTEPDATTPADPDAGPDREPRPDPAAAEPDAGRGARPVLRWRVGLRRLGAMLTVLGIWEVLARTGVVDPFYAPPPTRIGGTVAGLFADGSIYNHLEATFTAALLGLALGLVFGALAGALAALVPVLAELIEPVMVLLNAVPRVILAPLFVIWLGIGLGSKVALSFLLVTVLVFFAVYGGIRDTDQQLIDRIRTFGGGTRTLLREVYLPSIASRVLGNLKIAVGFAFTGAVVGEFVAASRGLGYLLAFAQSTYNAALALGLIALVMAFVLLLFGATGLLERRLLRWRFR